MTIVVTDAKGFEVGHQSGVFQPATHRILFEGAGVYGFENLPFRDGSGSTRNQELMMFLQLLMTLPSGNYGDLSWVRE